MKLYHSPTSPYVRKVMVLLHETGQLEDVEVMTVSTTPLTPADALQGKRQRPLGKTEAHRGIGPNFRLSVFYRPTDFPCDYDEPRQQT